MKLKYIFIPAILLTILVVGICGHFYNLDLLSMDHIYMIAITSFVALFTVFFGIYVCAYEASECVAERQTEYIDRYIRLLVQHINECFTAHNTLTKDMVKQELKEVNNLLVDVKSISIWARDHSLVAKNASSNCERLANEAIERLDNVLICLRGNDVEEKDVKTAIERLYGMLTNLKNDEILTDVDDIGDDEIRVVGE